MNANDIILPGFQIEVTRRCNLNCIQCNRKKDRKEKDLTFSQFKKIVDAAMPIQKVQLLGGGEPFLNKDIKKMIDYCGEKKIHMGIVTNGTLLPDTVYPHVTYVLSIDHIIEEEYGKIRVGSKLWNVIERVRKLRGKMDMEINTCMMKENIHTIPCMPILANWIGATRLNLITTVPHEPQAPDPEFLKAMMIQETNAHIVGQSVGVAVNGTHIRGPTYCGACFPTINLSGDVYMCCYVTFDPWDEYLDEQKVTVPTHNYKLGNIYETNFRDLFFSKKRMDCERMVRSFPMEVVPTEDLIKMRNETDVSNGFEFCRICLYRNSRLC